MARTCVFSKNFKDFTQKRCYNRYVNQSDNKFNKPKIGRKDYTPLFDEIEGKQKVQDPTILKTNGFP